MATAYLGRTVSNTGSKQKATLSMWTKRSGLGISPMRWDMVIGKVAQKDYIIDEMISI